MLVRRQFRQMRWLPGQVNRTPSPAAKVQHAQDTCQLCELTSLLYLHALTQKCAAHCDLINLFARQFIAEDTQLNCLLCCAPPGQLHDFLQQLHLKQKHHCGPAIRFSEKQICHTLPKLANAIQCLMPQWCPLYWNMSEIVGLPAKLLSVTSPAQLRTPWSGRSFRATSMSSAHTVMPQRPQGRLTWNNCNHFHSIFKLEPRHVKLLTLPLLDRIREFAEF